jgi:WXG100 family type VII secretion target
VSDRYTVDLVALSTFADRLARFNQRAEEISNAVDQCIAALHDTWLGMAAQADLGHHEKWMEADREMREGLEGLRKAAQVAHTNYSQAAKVNTSMWP